MFGHSAVYKNILPHVTRAGATPGIAAPLSDRIKANEERDEGSVSAAILT